VPLLHRVCRLPFRRCIATSAALMCMTALIGAFHKNMTLGDVPVVGPSLKVSDSLLIAACFLPTAIVGGMLGAKYTHRLPLRWLRVAFILLLCWASWLMLDLNEIFGNTADAFPY